MSFFESPRFPERIAMGASGGLGWITEVVATASRESRNSLLAYPRLRWEVSHGISRQSDIVTLRAFFLNARGRLHGWRYKDWTDYSATHTGSEESGKVSALSSTTFQMVKRYTSGAQTFDRQILKPVASTIEIKVSGIVDGTASVASTTGIITIASAPDPANVTWSGEFDVPCRFDTDQFDASAIARRLSDGLLHTWQGIPVVEDPNA